MPCWPCRAERRVTRRCALLPVPRGWGRSAQPPRAACPEVVGPGVTVAGRCVSLLNERSGRRLCGTVPIIGGRYRYQI
jgi:hypothetical protein